MHLHPRKPNVTWAASKAVCPVLFYSALLEPYWESCIHLWGPLHKKDADWLERAQRRATKRLKRKEHLSYKDGLRELGLFSLEKRKLWGDLRAAFQYLQAATRKLKRDFLQRDVLIEQGRRVLK